MMRGATRRVKSAWGTVPVRVGRGFGLAWLAGFLSCGQTAWAQTSSEPVRSGCELDYPPFCIVHKAGQADGFAVELMRAALAKMGREVAFRTGPWSEVKGWLERGEVEALPLVGRTPEREALFDFTVPYLTLHGAIVVRKDTTDVQTLADLRGRRVGVMKGDNAEEFLRREDRGFEIVTASTFPDVFHALAEGRCDAVVAQRLVAMRLLEATGLKNLKIVDRAVHDFAQNFCFAVKEGDRATLAMLNEGLALVVADGTHRRLHAKWFAHLELPHDRPIVIGGDHNFPPFEFLDKRGRPAGFTVELTRAIARELNLDVRIRLGPWADIVEALREGRIDAVQGMAYSAERDRVLDFSPRYLVIHCVSVVRGDGGRPPTTFEELAGRDLVVQAGDAIFDEIAGRGIQARIATVQTQEDVVRAVAEGMHDCGLVARYGALHAIRKHGWTHLKLGDRAFHFGQYGYAVPKGQDALLAQFTEGLRILKDSGEYQRLHEKWMSVYEEHFLWRDVLKYVGMVAGPLLLIAVFALLWSCILRRQVAKRTTELREKESFVRAVLDNLPVGVAVNSVESGVTFEYMNDLFPKIYRTTREALSTPDAFWEAAYPDPQFRGEIRARVLADCASGDPERMVWTDVPVARPGEPTTYITARNTPIPAANRMISSVWDVTERKRQELRIEHLNRVLRAIRDVNQLITHANDRDTLLRRSCEILISTRGYRSAWVALREGNGKIHAVGEAGIGKGFDDVKQAMERGVWPECCRRAQEAADGIAPIHNTDRNCKTCALSNTYRDTAALAGALRHGGHEYGALVVALPVGMADDPEEQSLFRELVGDVAYALHVMEVNRARIRMEARLRQAQKLEAIGTLAGGVAHEINNPVMGIMNYAELIGDKAPGGTEIAHFAVEIKRETERVAAIVRNLLSFARQEKQSHSLARMCDIVEGTMSLVRAVLRHDQIAIQVDVSEALPQLKCRSQQIQQVLMNLITNARDALNEKYPGHDGNKKISVVSTLFDKGGRRWVRTTVADTGPGIPDKVRERMFEPFYTTKPRDKGTGLGLSISHGIVKDHHGELSFESEVGEWTRFHVDLPVDNGWELEDSPEEKSTRKVVE